MALGREQGVIETDQLAGPGSWRTRREMFIFVESVR